MPTRKTDRPVPGNGLQNDPSRARLVSTEDGEWTSLWIETPLPRFLAAEFLFLGFEVSWLFSCIRKRNLPRNYFVPSLERFQQNVASG